MAYSTSSPSKELSSAQGVSIALLIIALWTSSLYAALATPLDYAHPLTYLWMLAQMHLFTGLFITAHDAMHGVVAPAYPKLNHLIGRVCALLFVYNSYDRLRPKHYLHHRHVATEGDPDYHDGHTNFFRWYLKFLREYVSWWQVLAAAITFNLVAIWFPKENLVMFWIIPSLLSTLQLFYFGTYLPHRGEHAPENSHRSRSQAPNHVWAFLSCYFFGYHYEHHAHPTTPWWKLWKVKEKEQRQA